jgi:hypothetical protein
MIELIKNFKFVEDGQKAMSEETKNEAIEFLRFIEVFAGGYSKFMEQPHSVFNQALSLWIIRLREAGFSQKKINGLCLRFGYSLKTEEKNAR